MVLQRWPVLGNFTDHFMGNFMATVTGTGGMVRRADDPTVSAVSVARAGPSGPGRYSGRPRAYGAADTASAVGLR